MNSTEIRASRSMNSPALNVPLADIFCLGPVFSGSRDRRKWSVLLSYNHDPDLVSGTCEELGVWLV